MSVNQMHVQQLQSQNDDLVRTKHTLEAEMSSLREQLHSARSHQTSEAESHHAEVQVR